MPEQDPNHLAKVLAVNVVAGWFIGRLLTPKSWAIMAVGCLLVFIAAQVYGGIALDDSRSRQQQYDACVQPLLYPSDGSIPEDTPSLEAALSECDRLYSGG